MFNYCSSQPFEVRVVIPSRVRFCACNCSSKPAQVHIYAYQGCSIPPSHPPPATPAARQLHAIFGDFTLPHHTCYYCCMSGLTHGERKAGIYCTVQHLTCRRDLSDRRRLANQHARGPSRHTTLSTASIEEFKIISFQ